MGLKQKIFADLEAACRPDAILSTNTSTIDISLVGAKTKAAERIVGAHFFSPAHIMPLLEIVRTPQTSKQARARDALPSPQTFQLQHCRSRTEVHLRQVTLKPWVDAATLAAEYSVLFFTHGS